MQVILREQEVKQAIALYLGHPDLTADDITEMKLRRKTAGTEDIGSVSVTFDKDAKNGKRKKHN